MKRLLFLIKLIITLSTTFAQTKYIVLEQLDGLEIKTKIINASSTEIKYKKYDNHHRSDYSILGNEITKIKYEDGEAELFNSLNPRIENRFGANINILGPSILLSLSIDYFITPDINIETGFGIIGYFGGIKYHIFGTKADKNWTPYVGLYATHIPEINFFGDSKSARSGLYVPVGIQYMGIGGFTFGVELAGLTVKDIAGGTAFWGALKIGYHF